MLPHTQESARDDQPRFQHSGERLPGDALFRVHDYRASEHAHVPHRPCFRLRGHGASHERESESGWRGALHVQAPRGRHVPLCRRVARGLCASTHASRHTQRATPLR